jgi:ATP-dependent Clp protease ATP-binding subunit ClpC
MLAKYDRMQNAQTAERDYEGPGLASGLLVNLPASSGVSYIFPNQEDKLFGQYSERAKRVVFIARFRAGRNGAAAIDTDHFIEALILEDQGKLADALGHEGVWVGSAPGPSRKFLSPEIAAEMLITMQKLLPHAKPIPEPVDMPLSADLSRTLDAALALMSELHQKQVETLHLLAAAASEESSKAAAALRGLGITRERVIAAIKSGEYS